MVWATDIPANVRWHQNRDTTAGCATRARSTTASSTGNARSAEYVTGGDTHIMTPLPRTVYGPDDWEDATLEQWLEQAEGGTGR